MIIKEYIFDPHLIDEMRKSVIDIRARAVYGRCLRNKKYSIADRIAKKYKIYPDDLAVSFMMYLIASKSK